MGNSQRWIWQLNKHEDTTSYQDYAKYRFASPVFVCLLCLTPCNSIGNGYSYCYETRGIDRQWYWDQGVYNNQKITLKRKCENWHQPVLLTLSDPGDGESYHP